MFFVLINLEKIYLPALETQIKKAYLRFSQLIIGKLCHKPPLK